MRTHQRSSTPGADPARHACAVRAIDGMRLHACLPACLPARLPARWRACLPGCLPACFAERAPVGTMLPHSHNKAVQAEGKHISACTTGSRGTHQHPPRTDVTFATTRSKGVGRCGSRNGALTTPSQEEENNLFVPCHTARQDMSVEWGSNSVNTSSPSPSCGTWRTLGHSLPLLFGPPSTSTAEHIMPRPNTSGLSPKYQQTLSQTHEVGRPPTDHVPDKQPNSSQTESFRRRGIAVASLGKTGGNIRLHGPTKDTQSSVALYGRSRTPTTHTQKKSHR